VSLFPVAIKACLNSVLLQDFRIQVGSLSFRFSLPGVWSVLNPILNLAANILARIVLPYIEDYITCELSGHLNEDLGLPLCYDMFNAAGNLTESAMASLSREQQIRWAEMNNY